MYIFTGEKTKNLYFCSFQPIMLQVSLFRDIMGSFLPAFEVHKLINIIFSNSSLHFKVLNSKTLSLVLPSGNSLIGEGRSISQFLIFFFILTKLLERFILGLTNNCFELYWRIQLKAKVKLHLQKPKLWKFSPEYQDLSNYERQMFISAKNKTKQNPWNLLA